jgi:RluA family pseudouridine synthase
MSQSIDKSGSWTIETPIRLVQFVRTTFELSASKSKLLILKGHFSVNEKPEPKPGAELSKGFLVTYEPKGPTTHGPFGVRKLHIDSHLVIVDKPSGLLSAPLEGSNETNALGAARRFCQHGNKGPKVVHRLDKATSGLLAFGRGVESTRNLAEQLVDRSMTRTYRAVVDGSPRTPSGLIVSRLVANAGKNRRGSLPRTLEVLSPNAKVAPEEGHGKWAATRFSVCWTKNGYTGLELNLVTGRTHQIRIHMAELGMPVCGETVYGRTRHKGRLALHAGRLVLKHPKTHQAMSFESEWPESLQSIWPWQTMHRGD